MELLSDIAAEFAKEVHAGQKYGNHDYFETHLAAVARIAVMIS